MLKLGQVCIDKYKVNFMKSNIFLRVITGCVVFFGVLSFKAWAMEPKDAIVFAETKGKELLMAFQEEDLVQRYQKLDEIFLRHIDVDYVARFVIGKYWRQMSEEQKEHYKDVFVKYGLAFYKTLPLEYAKNLKYEIMGAQKEGDFVNVAAGIDVQLGNEAQKIMLTFRLHDKSGVIKVVDVKVAESSLLLSYRSKFYQMIAECDNEIEWFLEDLNDLATSMENNLQQNALNQQKTP